MALECDTCESKHSAKDAEYCKSFTERPQLDKCLMHSKYVHARKEQAGKEDSPSYIWLTQPRDVLDSVTKTPDRR